MRRPSPSAHAPPQRLGALDAARDVVPVRRLTKGTLEGTGEMECAQADELRQRREREGARKVLPI